MCELYGTEWSIQLAGEETEAVTAGQQPSAAPSSQPSEPGLVPAAGAGLPHTPGLHWNRIQVVVHPRPEQLTQDRVLQLLCHPGQARTQERRLV